MKPVECADRNCKECIEEDCEEKIAQQKSALDVREGRARQGRDEAAGRYKTQMARKSRTARRISQSEHSALRRPLGGS